MTLRVGLVVGLLAVAAGACRNGAPAEDAGPGKEPAAEGPGAGVERAPAGERASAATGGAAAPAPAHDPAHPPIDCPLRKAGIDAAHLEPFEDTARYIAFLEREDRAAWQRPDAVVAALDLRGDETVVDLGAGSGYFTFRLARALPRGKVVALDVKPEMIRHVHHRAMTEGVENVSVALAGEDDPRVPAGADLVFVCDVLHHVRDRAGWLDRVAAALAPGARLALVEFREGELPQGPPESLKIPGPELVRLATGAGFELVREDRGLLPYQTMFLFRRP